MARYRVVQRRATIAAVRALVRCSTWALLLTLAIACSVGLVDAQLVSPDGGTTDAGTATLPPAGNPDGSCTTIAIPSQAQPVDTSHPTIVVGTGTPASCTFT